MHEESTLEMGDIVGERLVVGFPISRLKEVDDVGDLSLIHI